MVDLSVDLNGLKLTSPIITASGTYGYADEYDDFVNVQNLGAIVTKAISLEPRKGNSWKRIMEADSGMINSIGLENIGIEAFLKNILPILKNKNINFIVNIAGSTIEEYIKLAKICDENCIKAIELNLSCPNVKSGCLEFGTNEKILYELVKLVREKYSGILITKLTPNVTSIEKLAKSAQEAGADIISAINTLKATGVKIDFKNGKFHFDRIDGGLSGKAIKPVALRAINAIKTVVSIPIIGMGGISTLNDILEFVTLGADAVQIGTANFTQPTIAEDLTNELKKFIEQNGFQSFEELKHRIRKDLKNE